MCVERDECKALFVETDFFRVSLDSGLLGRRDGGGGEKAFRRDDTIAIARNYIVPCDTTGSRLCPCRKAVRIELACGDVRPSTVSTSASRLWLLGS